MFGKGNDARRGGSSRPKPNDIIDASPGDDSSRVRKGSQPRNIQETQAWQDGVGGARRMWNNYLTLLSTSFAKMSRQGQEQFITRLSQIVTIGSAALFTSIFYAFLPSIVRVFALPLVIVGAWWAGTNIVAPQMIVRFSQYLNEDV